jgi:hypothetical protein
MERDEKRAKRAAAQKLKAERKALAGLSRTVKLRLYPTPAQAEHINCTIGTIRFIWNQLWLPMLNKAEQARAAGPKRAGGGQEDWREAWRRHTNPRETDYNRAVAHSTSLWKASE